MSLSDKDTLEISCVATIGDDNTDIQIISYVNGIVTIKRVTAVIETEEIREKDTENLVEDETRRLR